MAIYSTGGDFADQARLRARADRHARSLPLLLVGLGLVVLAVMALTSQSPIIPMVVPAAAFSALLIVMRLQRRFTGVGVGRDGYGIALALAVVLPVLAPMMAFVTGPLILLGLGLVVLGWRGKDAYLWGPGLVLIALSPLLALGTFVNHVRFLGMAVDGIITWLAAIAVVALGAFWLAREGAAGQPAQA